MGTQTTFSLAEAHRHFAIAFNHQTWELLEKAERTPDEDALMVHTAHSSLRHWLEAGGPVHRQRGEWLLARVYGVLGDAQTALLFAESCLALTDRYPGEIQDFDIAFAYEGMARANAMAGHAGAGRHYQQLALIAGKAISDEEDRKIFLADFASGEWGACKTPEVDR